MNDDFMKNLNKDLTIYSIYQNENSFVASLISCIKNNGKNGKE